MELIKCECCGSSSLHKAESNVLKCDFCGSTYWLGSDQQIVSKELTDAKLLWLWDKAEDCRLAGKYADEVQILAEALELDENSAISWGKIGLAYRHLSWNSKALECYNKAIAIDPNRPRTYSNIGMIYFDKGDMQGAVMYFEKALGMISKEDKYYPTVLANYAHALGKLGDKKRAAAVLKDAERAGYQNGSLVRKDIGLSVWSKFFY